MLLIHVSFPTRPTPDPPELQTARGNKGKMDWCSIFEIRRTPISFLAHSWVLWERFVMQGIFLAKVVTMPLISKPQSTGFLSKLQIRSCFKRKVGMFLVYLTALWRWRDKTTNSSRGLLKRAHIRQACTAIGPARAGGRGRLKTLPWNWISIFWD